MRATCFSAPTGRPGPAPVTAPPYRRPGMDLGIALADVTELRERRVLPEAFPL
jgi:hypothetical protein